MQRTDSFEKTLMLGKLKAGGEGDDKGWDGWMASPTQWAWAWVNSGSWWQTGRPGMLPSMGSQRVGHDWSTELNNLLSDCFVHLNSTSLYFTIKSLPSVSEAPVPCVWLCHQHPIPPHSLHSFRRKKWQFPHKKVEDLVCFVFLIW